LLRTTLLGQVVLRHLFMGVVAVPSSLFLMLAASVRERRVRLGVSQEAFAARCGVHRTYIGKVERGEQNVSLTSLARIAHGLGVPIAQVLKEAEARPIKKRVRGFRQSGLVDSMGHPLAHDDERRRVLVSDLVLANDALLRRLQRHPTEVHRLSPREFEELVAEALARQGYDVSLTPIAKDGGKDMFVMSRSALGGALYVVECKKYAADRPVGVGVVRQLHGVVQAERLTGGIVATTSYFSQDAREFTTHVKYQLSLADFADVRAWIRAALARE
jgi:transcriptional regulator with XRE-family HTH domain